MNKISLQVPTEVSDTVEGLEQVAQTDANTETDDTSGSDQPEIGVETGKNADEDIQDGPATATSGRPGIDAVLSRVEEALGPEFAEVIRGLQTNTVQQGQLDARRKDLENSIARVEELESEIQEERRIAAKPSEPEEDLLADVDPSQLARLDAWKEREGLLTREEYESERATESAESLADDAIRKGIEEFGDDFGSVSNGTFTLNAAQKALMQPIFERFCDPDTGKAPDGLTYYDLYVHANHDKIVKAKVLTAVATEKKRVTDANSQRVTRVRAGAVAPRPAGGQTETPIYDAEASKGRPMRGRISEVLQAAKEKVLSETS